MFLHLDSIIQQSSSSRKAQIHLIILSASTNPTSALGPISKEQYDQIPTGELRGGTHDFRERPCGFLPRTPGLVSWSALWTSELTSHCALSQSVKLVPTSQCRGG